ncbi:MAG: zinc ABC transporter solute-binding protein [Planctomycetes bacterium]|nr:zinc ABC transporter solute-binding protein [Planctomycetota bacterium]
MKQVVMIIGLGVLVFCFSGCGGGGDEGAVVDGKVSVVVSIDPQGYFVERVGGEYVTYVVMAPPGSSPHTYEPTPQQMVKLGDASLYFSIGVPFEQMLLENITSTHESLKIVDTRAGITLRKMKTAHEHVVDSVAHVHEVSEPDPHIWLDPILVKQQAGAMAKALIEVDPGHKEAYQSNLALFVADLEVVHAEIESILAPLKGQTFLVYHPAFGYFGDRYGLVQEAVEIEGKDASPRQLTELIAEAKADKVKVIFVQSQFPVDSAEAVAAEIGGVVVPMDPLAKDYLENLRKMAKALEEGLKK